MKPALNHLSTSNQLEDFVKSSNQRVFICQRSFDFSALSLLRIEKLEKERTLSFQCRKNGWTDVCGELEEYEKVLEEERNTKSGCSPALQYLNVSSRYFNVAERCCIWGMNTLLWRHTVHISTVVRPCVNTYWKWKENINPHSTLWYKGY